MPQVGAPIQVKFKGGKHSLENITVTNKLLDESRPPAAKSAKEIAESISEAVWPENHPRLPFPRLEKIKGTFRVRLRFYEGQAMGSVWLLRKEGAQEEQVMHGQITKAKAGEVMEWFLRLGIVCSYEIVSLQTGVESAELNSGAKSGARGRKKKGAV